MTTNTNIQSLAATLRRIRDGIYRSGSTRGTDDREFSIWPTGLTCEAGEFLYGIVKKENAKRTIETGFAYGLATSFILEGVLHNHAKDRSRPRAPMHVVIDPYQSCDWGNCGLTLLRQAGVDSLVRFEQADSALALPRLVQEEETFDLGFVDGGHTFELAFLDIYYMTRLVRPGGVIVVDDVGLPAVQAAIGFFVRNLNCSCQLPPHSSEARRFAILRTPAAMPERAWNHFAPFWGLFRQQSAAAV